MRDNAGVGIRAAHDDELVGNSRGPVLEQNKDGAKENDGGKTNYDLLAIPIKQGSVSIARRKVYADRVFRAKTARRRSHVRNWFLDQAAIERALLPRRFWLR